MNTNLSALLPLLSIVAGALAVILFQTVTKKSARDPSGGLAALSLAAAAFFLVRSWGRGLCYFSGDLILDKITVVLGLMILVAGILIVFMGWAYVAGHGIEAGAYHVLLLLALAGLMIMVSSTNLLVIFLGLEVLSISSYALAGLNRNDTKSTEAAVKYFLTGSFATAFLVFGLALVFGKTGSLDLPSILASVSSAPTRTAAAAGWAGLVLIVAGFGFKIALVPFHMWAPDVYEGAPTPVTAFFSVGPKLAGFAVLFRLLAPLWGRGERLPAVSSLVWAVAAATILAGNLGAIRQRNLKRLLAYSSIAHSGYILVALLAGDGTSLTFYLVAYLFMNAGAFSALTAMSGGPGPDHVDLDDFAGLGFERPVVGISFAVFLFSLAGFPPTAGFLAKFYVFAAAVRHGHTGLVIIAAAGSLVSVYYYLKIVVVMYMKEPLKTAVAGPAHPALSLVLFLCLYGVFQLGLWPGNLLMLIRQAATSFF